MSRPALALTALSLVIIAVAVACSGGDSGSVPPPAPPTLAPTATPSSNPPVDPTLHTAQPVSPETIAAGRDLFAGGGGCGACHAVEGLTHGVLGPDLNGIATVAEQRIPGYTADQYIRESIVDSCAYTVPDTDCNLMLSVMNTLTLSDADVDGLVAFLLEQR